MSAIHEVDGRQDATITVALDIDHVVADWIRRNIPFHRYDKF